MSILLVLSLFLVPDRVSLWMREPNPKSVPSYVPEFLRVGVGLGLSLMYDGQVYDDFPGSCQHCGSTDCKKLGLEKQVVASLIVGRDGTSSSFVPVTVYKQKHYCKRCGRTYTARGPFYEGANYGTPIVDLALALSTENSAYGVERVLANMGIQVDRDTVLNYIRLLADKSKEFAPLIKNGGLYGINLLKIIFGVNDVEELKRKLPNISLESLSDEAYLRKKGALKKILEEITRGDKRVVHRGTKGDIIVVDGKDGKTTASFPDSFTLALSYLPGAEAYASLICTPQPFNQLLAEILFKALEGTSFNMTDGSRNYNGVKNHVLDPVHRTRTELKHDPKFRELKKELREEKKKAEGEAKGREEKKRAIESVDRKLEEVAGYARAKYQDVLSSTVEQVRREHPECFDGQGNFKGKAITSNGMEGGNFRMKYAIRVPYARDDSAAGKSTLAALKDSLFSLRKGKARESLANKLGFFSFSNVMTVR